MIYTQQVYGVHSPILFTPSSAYDENAVLNIDNYYHEENIGIFNNEHQHYEGMLEEEVKELAHQEGAEETVFNSEETLKEDTPMVREVLKVQEYDGINCTNQQHPLQSQNTRLVY